MPPRILLLAALVMGCGGAAHPDPSTAPPGAECRLVSEREGQGPGDRRPILAAAAPADTALLSPARMNVPIGLSCAGLPVPRLASRWSADSARRSWTLVVPSAAALANVWRSSREAAAALHQAGVVSVVPLDERRLVVSFRAPQDTVPAVFTDPALAAPQDAADSAAVRLLRPGGDLRDAIDEGADLVVTGNPEVLDYGAARGYRRHLLPWSRTYVLLGAGGVLPIVSGGDAPAFRNGLARDAVRVAARGAEPPYWWESAGCTRAPVPLSTSRTVAYPAGDGVARALAERIVAIADTLGVARELPERELPFALARGEAGAYVLPLPRRPTLPCRELAGWPAGASAVPLIDTRLTALVRDGASPLLVDGDGGLVPEPAR